MIGKVAPGPERRLAFTVTLGAWAGWVTAPGVGTKVGPVAVGVAETVTGVDVVTGVVAVITGVVVMGVVAVTVAVGVIALWARNVVTNASVARGNPPWIFSTKVAAIQRPLFNRYQLPSAFWATTVII